MSFGPTLYSQKYPDDPVGETKVDGFCHLKYSYIYIYIYKVVFFKKSYFLNQKAINMGLWSWITPKISGYLLTPL